MARDKSLAEEKVVREVLIAAGATVSSYLEGVEPIEDRRDLVEWFCAKLRADTGVGRPS